MSQHELPNNPNISVQELGDLHADAWNWCRSLAADQADDVLQQVYVMLIEGTAVFAGESSLKTWLFAVIRNVARREFRGQRYRRELLSRLSLSGEQINRETPPDSELPVARYLARLPARQRELLELYVYRDFSLSECAQILGIGIGSARTHYHRAKQSLRQQIEADL